MIREKLFLYNDFSSINKSCFSCHQFSHTIEQCPKLHFVPNIERIIKKHVFPIKNNRQAFLRHRKRSKNSLIYQISIKKVPKNKIFALKRSVGFEVDSDVSDDSHSAVPDETQEKDIKEITDLISISQPSDQKLPKKMLNFKNEFSRSLSEEVSHGESDSNVCINRNSTEVAIRKTFEGYKEYQKMGSIKQNSMIIQETRIDKVHSFVKYFPNANLENILSHRNKMLAFEKKIQRKYLKKKYGVFKNYTFYVNNLNPENLKNVRKEKVVKGKFSENKKDNTNNKTETSPLQRRSFFSKAGNRKSSIVSFVDLINTLIEKNRRTREYKKETP